MSLAKHTAQVKEIASDLGFQFCGISKAEFLEDESGRLEAWLNSSKQGQMGYMENHFDKRLDPRKLVPGAKSVVSLMYNYYSEEKQADSSAPKISSYAYGRDYHKVIKKKLKHFLTRIQEEIGEVHGRAFVDSAPVLEKAWAAKSGIGWIGKNANLIHPKSGSFFFLAELIIDLELDADDAIRDYCGTCTACIDACPTDAITPYSVDGSKCISYFTIELKEQIPEDVKGKMDNWMFGCDVCQDVCPWNRFSESHSVPDFQPKEKLLEMNKNDWQEITAELFDELFQGSAVKRTGYEGLKRNIKFLED